MNNEKEFWVQNLEKLDEIIRLLKMQTPLPEISTEEKKTLKLCNGKNTQEEIAKKTGKSPGAAGSLLTSLRQKGLIKSIKSGAKTTYKRI